MTYELLIRLVCAHVLADFFLQNKWMCEHKQHLNSAKGWMAQILHASIQALMAYVIVAEWTCWWMPAVIFGSHLLIDVSKALVGKKNIWTFLLDQVVHLGVIVALFAFGNGGFALPDWVGDKLWVIALAYMVILMPSSIFIDIFYKRWEEQTHSGKAGKKEKVSLPNGGKYIGYLERILIVTFVLAGSAEGIGFLLAAKSVFRFGDLQKSEDVRNTEYVLIGTFLSFSIAILVGMAAKMLL